MAERLKDDFREGQPIAGLPARWLNTIATFYNKIELMYGSVVRAPDGKVTLVPYQAAPGTAGGGSDYSFKATSNGDNTADMLEGDIHLGPDTTIAWASITNASTTITLTASATVWYVWLVIDVSDGAEAAEWMEGASITALTGDEIKTKMNWPLVKVTADGADPAVITGVKNLQCGDVHIPRL